MCYVFMSILDEEPHEVYIILTHKDNIVVSNKFLTYHSS